MPELNAARREVPMNFPRIEPVNAPPLLSLAGIGKTYGNTCANDAIDLQIATGDVLGLVGANGAGKSTLMRIICGVTASDRGTMSLNGTAVDPNSFSVHVGQKNGIRIVWQELSLCPNLSVAENFFIEQPNGAGQSPFWRADYHRLAKTSIETIFPGSDISTHSACGDLSLTERQMVEIARVASDPALRLLILDEPTSSLGAERSAQLRQFVRQRAAEGLAVIFISHKLAEVLDVSSCVVTMRNGRIVWQRPAADVTITDLVEAMGGPGARDTPLRQAAPEKMVDATAPFIRLDGRLTERMERPIQLERGQIIGLAGLEGSGQKTLLHDLFTNPAQCGVQGKKRVRFISGDRQKEGVFPLWSVLDNISIGRIAKWPAFRLVHAAIERSAAREVAKRLALDENRLNSKILQLSGGNQQKALVARALTDDFDILLLDDPTRGVDIAAKRDFYRLIQEIAASGRLVIWHSTEDLEFLECDRVLVFSKSQIVKELRGTDIAEESIVAASFTDPSSAAGIAPLQSKSTGVKAAAVLRAIPFVSLFLVFLAMTWQNPLVASSFGLELLLTPAVTLVLIALSQMFIIGGSEIDLGVGAFAGLINVISATLLVTSPALGLLALVGGLAGYAVIGLLIQARAIPAIVVTLGASFIWTGLGQTLQPSPGGSSPEWLSALVAWSIPGIPTPLILILIAAVIAFFIDSSPTGTVLRGFGSNALALARAGWSPLRYAVLRYVIGSLFAIAAGLFVTASNHASDINASSSFTLLSVAAVVIGGCQLLGGLISPLGVVAGAVTMSLIGALLASLGVSTDYNAAVQGFLLISILGFQTLMTRRHRHV